MQAKKKPTDDVPGTHHGRILPNISPYPGVRHRSVFQGFNSLPTSSFGVVLVSEIMRGVSARNPDHLDVAPYGRAPGGISHYYRCSAFVLSIIRFPGVQRGFEITLCAVSLECGY
jgi:hypothetical protein